MYMKLKIWSITCVNEPQTPFNSETETFMHEWLCKLYFAFGSEGCKVYDPKMAFVSFALDFTMTRKRLDYVAIEEVLPARLLVLNG